MNRNQPRIAIVGAGVIGLSIARSLAMLGAEVTIFERSHMGAGTSSRTFAWINANGKKPDSYYALNYAGMQEHLALQNHSSNGARWLDVCGTFEWATHALAKDRLTKRVESLADLEYPLKQVSQRELQQFVPEIRIPPTVGEIWHFPQEALLYPSILMARLWSEARSHGALLRDRTDVVDIAEAPGVTTLQLSDGSHWQGDYCVLATGRWTPSLTSMLGAPLAMIDANQATQIGCGFLALTDPQYVQLRSNLITPELNVRPDGGGRLLLQAPDLDYRADPATQTDVDGYIGREILARLRRLFDNTDHAHIEKLVVGQRSRPADGLPAVGFLTDMHRTYVVVTHSGMTLAPLLGRLVALELMLSKRDPLLEPYSPARLINREARDFAAIATIHFPAAQ